MMLQAGEAPRHRTLELLALFGGVLVIRLMIILLFPCDLAGDEAYYWEWGQHPAWGYYSKPPGIAWIMALAGWLGDHSVTGIRLMALGFGMGSGWWIYLLGQRIYGQRAGMLAALLFFVTPAAAGLSFLLTIDAPLVFFWSGALYFFVSVALFDSSSRGRQLLGLALCIACGTLVKQMMLMFPIGGLLALWLANERPGGRGRGPVIAALLLPILVLVPNLMWNAQHDWPTAKHTAEHFAASPDRGVVAVAERLGEFAASQLGLASPVLGVLIGLLGFAALRRWKAVDATTRVLWLFSAPGLLVMVAGNLTQRINPNWPAVFYLSAIVLCAGWLTSKKLGEEPTAELRLPGSARAWRRWSLGVGASLTLAIYLGLALSTWQIGPAKLLTATQRLHGWSALAAAVEKLRRDVPNPDDTILISRSHRFLTSQLAFLLPDHPPVYRYSEKGRIDSQHAFWPGPEIEIGADAIIILVGPSRRLPSELRHRFQSTEKITEIEAAATVAGGPVTIFLGRDLREWPP